jgi:hypothetical protein
MPLNSRNATRGINLDDVRASYALINTTYHATYYVIYHAISTFHRE